MADTARPTPGRVAFVNPFVFIVGCLRSGTTVFRNVVDAHPRLAIVNETQWLPRLWELRHQGTGFTSDGMVTPAVIPTLLSHARIERLEMDEAQLRECLGDRRTGIPYNAFVSNVFDAYGERRGKALVGEKSPGYVRHLPTLGRLWPDARVVHLVRDGRDVCLSLRAWKPEKIARTVGRFSTWNEEPVITAALWWEWHVRLGLEARAHLGLAYHQLRYEDLIADPGGALRPLCTFLGLEYDPAMLHYHEHATTSPPARGSAAPLRTGLRDWRSQLSDADVDRFAAASAALLDELGYAPAGSPTLDMRRTVAEVRERFSQEAAIRRRRAESWAG